MRSLKVGKHGKKMRSWRWETCRTFAKLVKGDPEIPQYRIKYEAITLISII